MQMYFTGRREGSDRLAGAASRERTPPGEEEEENFEIGPVRDPLEIDKPNVIVSLEDRGKTPLCRGG